MAKVKSAIPAFLFSYIEGFTAFSGFLLILFVAARQQTIEVTARQERLLQSWSAARDSLAAINAEPVPDPQMGGMRISVAEKQLFPIQKTLLNPDGVQKIREIALRLREFIRGNKEIGQAIKIKVGGHTDRVGGDTVNFPLSYRRAFNVAAVLDDIINHPNRLVDIVPIAYASQYPVDGHYEERDPINRRITIVIELLSTELLSSSVKVKPVATHANRTLE